jgi:hypothetical protein
MSMKSAMPKRNVIAVAIIVVLALAIGLGWQYWSDRHHESHEAHDAASPAATNASHSHNHRGKAKHSHDISAALRLEGPEYIDIATRWFDPPVITKANQFVATSTPLNVDASCTRRGEMQYASLETSIRKSAGVDTTQPIPLDAIAQQVSQFWQHDGWFYQISAGWEKDIPAMYNLEYYRTRQADFQSGVERLPLANSTKLDALSMGERIDEIVAEAEAKGAKRGARMVQLLLGGSEGDSMQDLKIHNGRPVAWMFGYGHCRLRTDGKAYCKCVDAAKASQAQKGEYKVID